MLEARDISKVFLGRAGQQAVTALDRVSLQIEAGETLGLMGPSGCGKSTLARVLLRLMPADSGQVYYRNTDITELKGKQLLPFRREVQLIAQRPESSFDPGMKLGSSMMEPLKIFGLYEKATYLIRLSALLEQVKLDRSLLDRYPHQVSGGEVQRLAICRALLLEPRLLVLDEATSMLDVSVQAQILHILGELQAKQGLAYLFISHDEAVVAHMADRILRMDKGRLVG